MVQLSISNTEQFVTLSKRLKSESKEFRRELSKGITATSKPLSKAVKAAARSKLPRRGGLAARIASARIGVRRRSTGASAGVRLVSTHDYDIRSIDKGKVRHKTYGRPPWHSQRVPPGYWTETLNQGAPQVRKELKAMMERIADRVRKGL